MTHLKMELIGNHVSLHNYPIMINSGQDNKQFENSGSMEE